MRLMKEDDHFNAPLTPLGRAQARTVHERLLAAQGVVGEEVPSRDTRPRGWGGLPPVDLIVSSPLGRALDTAVAVFPMETSRGPFIAIEAWRERSGWMVNSQRPTRSVLEEQYPICDFSDLASEEDAMWGEALEVEESCAARGFRALCGVWARPERHVAVAAHGGIFHYLLNNHQQVVADEGIRARFSNCELRSCVMSLREEESQSNDGPVFCLRTAE